MKKYNFLKVNSHVLKGELYWYVFIGILVCAKQHVPNNCPDDIYHLFDGHRLIIHLDFNSVYTYDSLVIAYAKINIKHKLFLKRTYFLGDLKTALSFVDCDES